ncbi:MAG: FAD binding domain-containing protein [Ilumatobacteraceae bacterium]
MSVFVPTSLADAVQVLADHPSATVIAGGTDVMVELNGGHRRADDVVVVNRVPELRTWRHDGVTLRLGAGVTYGEIEREPIATWAPALAQAARTVGSPQIRHAATVGGNLGTCSPAGDGLPVLAALEAVVELTSPNGVRDVPFAEFMVGPKRTSRRTGELITAVTVPVADGYQGYTKVGVRNAMVIATASVALVVHARTVRIALGSVGPTILRCPEAEALAESRADFDGRRLSTDVVEQCVELVRAASRPIDDHRSTAAYRRHAVGVLAGRLLRRAFPNE